MRRSSDAFDDSNVRELAVDTVGTYDNTFTG